MAEPKYIKDKRKRLRRLETRQLDLQIAIDENWYGNRKRAESARSTKYRNEDVIKDLRKEISKWKVKQKKK